MQSTKLALAAAVSLLIAMPPALAGEYSALMKAKKYPFPTNIEYEYRGAGTPKEEVAKCFEFCKNALA